LIAGIAGLNPAEGMDVFHLCLYVVLFCVGRGLCDGLMTLPKESYRVSYFIRLRKLLCEAAMVLTKTVQPLMMMMMMNYQTDRTKDGIKLVY
jgi:hypothetical protein